MVAAAAEAVGAADGEHFKPSGRGRRHAVDRLGQGTGRAVILPADGALCGGGFGIGHGAQAFAEHAHLIGDMLPANAVAVADHIIVEHGADRPAALCRRLGQQLAAEQALFLAGECGVDDGRVEPFPGEQPCRFEHQRDAGGIVVRARRIGACVHHIAHAAVDMPLHDDDAIRIARSALDAKHIFHAHALRNAIAGHRLADRLDRDAAAAIL